MVNIIYTDEMNTGLGMHSSLSEKEIAQLFESYVALHNVPRENVTLGIVMDIGSGDPKYPRIVLHGWREKTDAEIKESREKELAVLAKSEKDKDDKDRQEYERLKAKFEGKP